MLLFLNVNYKVADKIPLYYILGIFSKIAKRKFFIFIFLLIHSTFSCAVWKF